MKQKVKRVLMLPAGIWLLVLIGCSIVILVFFPKLLHTDSKTQREATKELFAMNTYVSLTAYGENAETALEEAGSRLTELEHLWSVTDADSDIYALNHSNGQPVIVNEETAELLSFALQMAEETNGALEPTIYPVLTAWGFTTEENWVPSETEIAELLERVGYELVQLDDRTVRLGNDMLLDLGAVGKGYAGDLLTQIIKEYGVTSALLDIGGNIQAVGAKPDGSDWRLGLRDPFSDGTLGVLNIND